MEEEELWEEKAVAAASISLGHPVLSLHPLHPATKQLTPIQPPFPGHAEPCGAQSRAPRSCPLPCTAPRSNVGHQSPCHSRPHSHRKHPAGPRLPPHSWDSLCLPTCTPHLSRYTQSQQIHPKQSLPAAAARRHNPPYTPRLHQSPATRLVWDLSLGFWKGTLMTSWYLYFADHQLETVQLNLWRYKAFATSIEIKIKLKNLWNLRPLCSWALDVSSRTSKTFLYFSLPTK